MILIETCITYQLLGLFVLVTLEVIFCEFEPIKNSDLIMNSEEDKSDHKKQDIENGKLNILKLLFQL